MTGPRLLLLTSLLAAGTAVSVPAPVVAADPGDDEVLPADLRLEEAFIGRGGGARAVYLHGQLVVPGTTSEAKACHGRVRMSARVDGKLIAAKSVALSSRCWFNGTMNVGSVRRARLTVTFAGNDEMGAVSMTRTIKVQRPKYDPNIG